MLAKSGTQIQVMALHSYLFFGSANGLHEHIKTLLAAHPDCRFLVFDFRLVNGVDFLGHTQLHPDQARCR